MDPSLQYQQQQSQPYDPSYYPYQQYGNYQYYPQDYSNYQQQPHPVESSSSVHPPGVPIDSQQQYLGQDQYYAYHHHQQQHQYDAATWQGSGAGTTQGAHVASHPSQYDSAIWHDSSSVPEATHVRPHLPVGPSYSGGSRRGGRGGGSSFSGRGRGRGRGGAARPLPGAPPKQAAPQMAWCELCRVDCNTSEILQKHLEGKKHQKNIKMREELERLNKIIVEREAKKVEEKGTGELQVDQVKQNVGERGRGSKRKARGGRGGISNKWIRNPEGSKTQANPPNTIQNPYVCELCHVTCESQVVFDSHIKGKKHMSNVHYLQEQQTLLGQVALEALYPALQALIPALQGNYQANPDVSGYSAFDPQFPQDGQDPQAVLAQVITSLLASGQAGATAGAASTSALVPPPVTEELKRESQGDADVAGESGDGDVKTESETEKIEAQTTTEP